MPLLLLLTILFTGCATKRNLSLIDNEQYDGLSEESIVRYTKARKETLKNISAYLKSCYTKSNDSQNIYERAIKKNKYKASLWNARSSCYIYNDKLTQAMYTAKIAFSMAKKKKMKAIILNNIAVIHLKNEKYTEAKDHLKQAIKLAPTLKSTQYNLATLYIRFGLYNKSQKILKKLIKDSPKDIDFNNRLAEIALIQNKYNRALWYLERIPEDYRQRDDIALNFATTYYALKQYDNALAIIKNARRNQNSNTVALNQIEKVISQSK